MLTDDTTNPRVPLDPEYFITAKGPFNCYNRLEPADITYPDGMNDGVCFVVTKLGPPKFRITSGALGNRARGGEPLFLRQPRQA